MTELGHEHEHEHPALRKARRRYVTVCALFWLPVGLGAAPLVLLLTERGMSLATVAGLGDAPVGPPR